MLKELRLKNIVLVESASILFKEGFNVLSGESGSGKSAIINALSLIAGDRCDLSALRRDADKGSVEAVFDVEGLPLLLDLLEASGIDHEPGNELFIRRELTASGKSRAFINNQLAQLTLLRQVSDHLFNMVGQHANQKLLSLDYHRKALDLAGDLQLDIKTFAKSWDEENQTRQTLETLVNSEAQRLRELEMCRIELEELQEANLKEGEEEEVFEEYTRLSNADALAETVGQITGTLSGERNGVLPILNRLKSTFEQLAKLTPALTDTAASYQNALLELQEVSHTLNQFEGRIEHNPQRADHLSQRLEIITRLKRKYGQTIQEIHAYEEKIQAKIKTLENADIQIEDLQSKLKQLSEKNQKLANELTTKRKKAAKLLEEAITDQLHDLNMPKAQFHIEIASQSRNSHGDDRIEFFLTPNIGEKQISLRECASGGELSRVTLALQAVLAGKENIPTLIFDEVDANIGGETASIVGEKLCEIGRQHQVLCITHFPQVAKQAQHHLCISKQEQNGRTITQVDSLDNTTRERELARMSGR